MASRKDKIRNKLLATLVTEKKSPCVFCQRIVDDEITYGKLYALGDIQCHYFCVLLSCCLIQKGKDEEGLFGFMYSDIMAEVERCKKHRCSYCSKSGANLGCSISQCRKQFHLPCGRERNAVSLYYGNYKSFCKDHAPKQKIPDHIMTQAKLRMKLAKGSKNLKAADLNNLKELNAGNSVQDDHVTESVCVICYEAVDGFPTVQTFWPPCCARDAWFHRSCLQRMALSAGMHYLKCPLCNDKESFYDAVVSQGYYVPDRDAAWELEQNAFAEIYERPLSCSAAECKCPNGRDHDADNGMWDIKLCMLCGTLGAHAACLAPAARFVCETCAPAAPTDLDSLASSVDALMRLEQQTRRAENARRGPIMPSRMSLRRTKQRSTYNTPSTSQNSRVKTESDTQVLETNTTTSRLELNIKSPKYIKTERPILQPNILQNIENKLLSPIKMLEQGLHEKVRCMGVRDMEVDAVRVVEQMREKFKKPRPLSEKRRIVNDILDNLFGDLLKENPKTKDVIKEWNSPRKNCDIENAVIEELVEKTEPVKQEIEENPVKTDTPNNETGEDPETVIEKDVIEPQKDIEDDSSNSTFQLPPEFIAENSDDSLPFEPPNKLTTVDIKKDSSLEISADEEIVNIDVINVHNDDKETAVKNNLFKFSPLDKVAIKKDKSDIDLESFKNYYLNEVDRDFKCNFNHKHTDDIDMKTPKLRTAIDFAIDAIFQQGSVKSEDNKLKRKVQPKDVVPKKKRKRNTCVLKYNKNDTNIKVVCSDSEKNVSESIDLTLESRKEKRRHKKVRKSKKVLRENIQVKIKWKKEQLRLKITKSQTKKAKKIKKVKNPSTLKQYILQRPSEVSKNVIMKPEHDVTPKKRKYVKLEKSPDNLVQTSIQNFFKVKLPDKSVKCEPEAD